MGERNEWGKGTNVIIVALLLRTHGADAGPVIVPEQGLLLYRTPRPQHIHLASDLDLQGLLDTREGVHILDLGLYTQVFVPRPAHGYVRVDPEATLLHVAVADVHVLQDLLEHGEERAGVGGRAEIRLRDDLHEWGARPVVPARRYRYYLTPKGFAEKSRLTAQYFSSSLFLFREARNQFTELLHLCQTRRWHRVALYGNSELSEIASLCAMGLPLVISGIVDHDGRSGHVAGHRLVPVLETLGEIDAVIITDLNDPQGAFDALMVTVPSERILAPRLLNISREPKAT